MGPGGCDGQGSLGCLLIPHITKVNCRSFLCEDRFDVNFRVWLDGMLLVQESHHTGQGIGWIDFHTADSRRLFGVVDRNDDSRYGLLLR